MPKKHYNNGKNSEKTLGPVFNTKIGPAWTHKNQILDQFVTLQRIYIYVDIYAVKLLSGPSWFFSLFYSGFKRFLCTLSYHFVFVLALNYLEIF